MKFESSNDIVIFFLLLQDDLLWVILINNHIIPILSFRDTHMHYFSFYSIQRRLLWSKGWLGRLLWSKELTFNLSNVNYFHGYFQSLVFMYSQFPCHFEWYFFIDSLDQRNCYNPCSYLVAWRTNVFIKFCNNIC